MANLPIRPITTKQRIMGCVVLFKPEGTNKYIKIGACESVEITPNITRVPSYTPEFGDRRMIGNFTTEKTGEVTINGISMWTEFLYQTLFMGKKTYFTQAASTGNAFTIEDVAVGDVVRLPGIRATNVEFADDFVEDVHYTLHAKTNTLEIIGLPLGVADDAALTYDLPEVTEAEKLLNVQVMSESGTRGELNVIGVIRGGPGKEVETVLPDVEFMPSGAISMGDTSGLNLGALTGSMYSTGELGYGYTRALEAL